MSATAIEPGGQGGESRALSTLPVANRWEWRLRRTLANAAITAGEGGRYDDALRVLAMIATDTGADGAPLGIEWRTRRMAASDLFRLGLKADEVLQRAEAAGAPDADGQPVQVPPSDAKPAVVVNAPQIHLHFDRPTTDDVAAALAALTQGSAPSTNGKARA